MSSLTRSFPSLRQRNEYHKFYLERALLPGTVYESSDKTRAGEGILDEAAAPLPETRYAGGGKAKSSEYVVAWQRVLNGVS